MDKNKQSVGNVGGKVKMILAEENAVRNLFGWWHGREKSCVLSTHQTKKKIEVGFFWNDGEHTHGYKLIVHNILESSVHHGTITAIWNGT